MEQFADLVARAGGPATTPDLASFSVPPRFTDARFTNYRPDAKFPSQAAALQRVSGAVQALNDEKGGSGGFLGRFRKRDAGWSGLYLDGGFGVGKTHLLAAAWRASEGCARAYLSFQELTYVVGALGMPNTLDLLGAADMVCLDEFELDDPGNTMLATSFVRGALERGARVLATSNTLPNELGRGRFSTEMFQREIGQLAASFESLRIDGEDYRHRRFSETTALTRLLTRGNAEVPPGVLVIDWSDLLRGLAGVHPIQYARIAAGLDSLWLEGVEPLPDQDTALRFVHFADKLYDFRTQLYLRGDVALDELFPSTIGYGPFERKFRRCRSRLFEMLSEPSESAGQLAADD